MRSKLKIALAATLGIALAFIIFLYTDFGKDLIYLFEYSKAQKAQAEQFTKISKEFDTGFKSREKQIAEEDIRAIKAAAAKAAQVAQAEAAAQAAALALANSPSKYIWSNGCTYNETGLIHVYINIQACNFVNSSDFPVIDISGNILATTPKGTKAIPFRASGRLEANRTNMLPIIGIQKVQIPGKFTSYRVEVLKVTVTEDLREGG